jgi:two-component system alkaline phosphatase synthesis response regulator PhoP
MTAKKRILVVEDEPDLAMGLRDNLQFEGYEVVVAPDGEQGLELALAEKPDLMLLDIMLPGIDGFEVCSRLREQGFLAPIIMLTARGQEIDKVRGLELGADDYITKPFGVRELLARLKAALRRSDLASSSGNPDETVTIGRAVVSISKGRVTRGKKSWALGHFEGEILRTLLAANGEIVKREVLLRDIWGLENEPMNRSADNHMVACDAKSNPTPPNPGTSSRCTALVTSWCSDS